MTKPARKMRVQTSQTPVRAALEVNSLLRAKVSDGLGAVKQAHRIYFDESVRPSFADSLDLDEGLRRGHEQENRWDYLLGHKPSNQIVGVEPHSAENSEVSTVINKRKAALRQLQDHFCNGKHVEKWLWVASGKVHFAPMEKATFRLAENGITFVGRKITKNHLS